MAYRDGGYRGNSAWVGIVVALLLLGWCSAGPLSRLGQGASPTSPEGVERALFANPKAGEVYRTLKRTYPEEFETLKQQVARHARAGESHDAIEEVIVRFVIDALARHRRDMVQAPHDALAAYRSKEIGVVEALRDADPALCARYVTTGTVRTPRPIPALAPLLMELQKATWEASAAGRDRPTNRKVLPPTEQDLTIIRKEMMLQGVDAQAVEQVLESGRSAGAPEQQCEAGLAFLHAIHRLPPERADGLDSFLIQQIS